MDAALSKGGTSPVVAFFASLAAGLWMTFAIWMLWGWFLAPLGVSAIGFWHALGIRLLIGLFTLRPNDFKDRDSDEHLVLAWYYLLAATVVLLAGWLVSFGVPGVG